jgi:predicted metal-dependent phosphoesterase TrpH
VGGPKGVSQDVSKGVSKGVSLRGGAGTSFVDLHSHTSWSPDSLSRPEDVVRVAAERGLSHLAITDHGRIEGALAARDAAPEGLTVIVGQEVRTQEGDLIGLFLERPIAAGLSTSDAVDAIHAQGGLVGLPHPFDRFRGSILARRKADPQDSDPHDADPLDADPLDRFAPLVDYVETFNARVPMPGANDRAAEWAARHGLPGVAVSDAHTLIEVGVAYLILEGPIADAEGLRAALPGGTIVASRASLAVRAFTPFAKLIQRLRYPQRFGQRAS